MLTLFFFQNPENRPDFDAIVEQCSTVIAEPPNIHNPDVNNNGMNNSCGANCKWIFDERMKMLFLRGSGKMKDYEWDYDKQMLTTPLFKKNLNSLFKLILYLFCPEQTNANIPVSRFRDFPIQSANAAMLIDYITFERTTFLNLEYSKTHFFFNSL